MLLCLTEVLSTYRPTQLIQVICQDSKILPKAKNMDAAVADPVPEVKHMSGNLVHTAKLRME